MKAKLCKFMQWPSALIWSRVCASCGVSRLRRSSSSVLLWLLTLTTLTASAATPKTWVISTYSAGGIGGAGATLGISKDAWDYFTVVGTPLAGCSFVDCGYFHVNNSGDAWSAHAWGASAYVGLSGANIPTNYVSGPNPAGPWWCAGSWITANCMAINCTLPGESVMTGHSANGIRLNWETMKLQARALHAGAPFLGVWYDVADVAIVEGWGMAELTSGGGWDPDGDLHALRMNFETYLADWQDQRNRLFHWTNALLTLDSDHLPVSGLLLDIHNDIGEIKDDVALIRYGVAANLPGIKAACQSMDINLGLLVEKFDGEADIPTTGLTDGKDQAVASNPAERVRSKASQMVSGDEEHPEPGVDTPLAQVQRLVPYGSLAGLSDPTLTFGPFPDLGLPAMSMTIHRADFAPVRVALGVMAMFFLCWNGFNRITNAIFDTDM